MNHSHSRFFELKNYAILITIIVIWSSSFAGIRIGINSLSPTSLALLRFIAASFFMAIPYFWQVARGHPLTSGTRNEWIQIILLGVVGFGIYNIGLNTGEMTVSTGVTSFLMSQIPAGIVILAWIFLKEELSIYTWMGLFISTLGMGLIAKNQQNLHGSFIGIMYLLVAVMTGAIYAVGHKPILKKFNPIEYTTYAIWAGTVFLALLYTPQLLHELPHATASSIWAAIYLGLFPGAIGYLGWSYVLVHMPASRAGGAMYLMPIFATLIGWLAFGEHLSLLTATGGLLALMGAVLINQKKPVTSPRPWSLPRTPIRGERSKCA